MEKCVAVQKQRRSGPETRALVLEEAERLLIEVGYQGTSVAEIAKTLDMSPANVFKHFKSKADLAYAVIAARLSKKSPTRSTEGLFRLRTLLFDILKELIDFSRKEPKLFSVLATMVSAEDAAAMLRLRLFLELQGAVEDVKLPIRRDLFLDALADVFICVLHPATIASTEEAALWKRANNVVLIIELAMAGTSGGSRKSKETRSSDAHH
jgi:TetR/AcrR family transcriptional repressor of the ameABC operon